MEPEGLPYRVRPMRFKDVRKVSAIEHLSFPTPWPASAYRYELRQGHPSYYFVLEAQASQEAVRDERPSQLGSRLRRLLSREENTPRLLGYGGFWLVRGEVHISTLAIHPDMRGKGLGELLFATMLREAITRGAEFATLEVRTSNLPAQNLYRKYGFAQVGLRPRYYTDNQEDALLMRLEALTSAQLQGHATRTTGKRTRQRSREANTRLVDDIDSRPPED